MSKPTYSVSGTANVVDALNELGRKGSDVAIPASEVVAIGVSAARSAAPVRSGRLAGEIDGRSDAAGGELALAIEYGPYMEFGTRYVAGHRMMRAGYDAMEAAAADPFERHLETVVTEAQKG